MTIGITGGIGSGKSYVVNILKQKGFECFDCDKEAKKLMMSDPIIIWKICSCVGINAYKKPIGKNPEIDLTLQPDTNSKIFQGWTLNKSIISDYLFKNEENTKKINSIVHPALSNVFINWTKQRQDKDVFLESAILFESGFNRIVDFVLLVTADESVRIRRTMLRDQISYDSVMRKINRQANQQEIANKADYIIYNNGCENLEEQIENLIKLLNIKK